MVSSLNTTAEHVQAVVYLHFTSKRGQAMLGDKAFEFYPDANVKDFIQIPWSAVTYVAASVLFGRWIPRFALFTQDGRHYTFSGRDNKAILRVCRNHLGEEKMRRSPSFFDVLGRGVGRLFAGKSGKSGNSKNSRKE